MTNNVIITKLAKEYWINYLIVQSWLLQGAFKDVKSWQQFFKKNNDIIKAKPVVKWVWWKRQLISQLEKLFPKDFNNYFEPFVWWGAVFFNLQREKSSLYDINEELINTYQVIKNSPNELIKFLETLTYDKETFLKIRSWDREENWKQKYTKIQRAWRFLYLNRTCFNWLYRVNSKWQFNVPMWAYKNPDFVQKENIINASKLLNKTKAEIECQSYKKVLEKAQTNDFVYFDPPYDVLTDTANFTSYNKNWFWKEEQKELSDVFKELDKRWVKLMLSNHNTPYIRELYTWYRFEIVKAKRAINSKASWRGVIDEIVVRNY